MVTVTGTILHPVTGNPATGTVTFSIPYPVRTNDGYLIGTLPATVATVTGGTFTVSLPATDTANVVPRDWVYTITVNTDAWVGVFQAGLPSSPSTTTFAAMTPTITPPPVATYVPLTAVGAASGVASLDGTGHVPAAQLPNSGGVQTVTAGSGKIVVGGTGANPTVDVGTGIPESAVTNLTADLAGKLAAATVTTKGDLLVGTGNAAIARQAAGSNGQVLAADSTQAGGVRWATPAVIPTVRSAWITSGDTALPNTGGGWQALAGFELDLPAAVGQWVEIGVHGMRSTTANGFLDVGVIVGTSIVRYLATGTSTPGLEGDPGWYGQNTFMLQSAGRGFTVASGDLDGGNVRFVVAVKATGAGTLYSSSNYPFYWRAICLGTVT